MAEHRLASWLPWRREFWQSDEYVWQQWWRWLCSRRARTTKPLDLTPYRGQWVAFKDGRLVGHAPTTEAIVDAMVQLGPAGRGTTIWYEAHPEEVKRFAVMDSRGRIGPNCYFNTQEQAERWVKMWEEPGKPADVVVTRDGQHGSWRPVGEGQRDG